MRAPLLLLPAGLAATLALGGCDVGMGQQAKYRSQAPAASLPGGYEQQAAPEGTVAQGQLAYEAAEAHPPPITLALVEQGRDRHEIACKPCHAQNGEGDGAVVQRGFPHPLPYGDPRMRALSGQQIYDAITNGYGVMFPQAERVPIPADRWAIVAYVRALQLQATPATGSQAPVPEAGQ